MDGLAGRDVSDVVLTGSSGDAKVCTRGMQGACGTLFVGQRCPHSTVNIPNPCQQVSARLIHQSAVRGV